MQTISGSFSAAFIVPTRHLKGQQRDAFWDFFHPSSAVAVTKTSQFRRTFDDPGVSVLMITAQILVNALRDGKFRFQEVSMLVFDECHHTTLNHPYNEIMKMYMQEKKRLIDVQRKTKGAWLVGLPFAGLPQIVGLTASLGTGGSRDAVQHIVNLSANLDCTGVITVTEPSNLKELEGINRPPELDKIISTSPRAPSEVSICVEKTLQGLMRALENRFLIGKSTGGSLRPYGSIAYETWIGPIASQAENENRSLYPAASYLLKLNTALLTYHDLPARYVLHAFETFKVQNRAEFDLTRTGKECREMYEFRVAELKQLVPQEDPLDTPKLKELVNKLERVFTAIPNSRGIVLARTRFATLALLDFISYHFSSSRSVKIRPTRIVGQGKETEDAQSAARQEDALHQFKTGEANLLIATDIVQEGLDVPACNFIIRYNFVSNEIGTVQSKGRARAKNSQCFLLVEKDSINEKREHENRQRVRDMDEAIKRINAMDKEVWLARVGEKQLAILAEKKLSPRTSTVPSPSPSARRSATSSNHQSRFLCKHCRTFTRLDLDEVEEGGEAPNHVQRAARNMLSDRARIQALKSLSRMSADKRHRPDSCHNCGKPITS
ncbi:antiviral innate immune response receptor RIG-I-like [Lytechinus pictus]|uniref:antiviral innate immune response receptor RIG-I-like n=1 Tax=Lytechinus pictus TaxID=7653 RepID=UPI0030B9D4EC